MAENSKIEWCDHSFNPFMGCTKVSPACDHCYAEAQTGRFKQVGWGPHADRVRTSAANWNKVKTWNRRAAASGIRQRVFVASLADVFDNHKSIKPEWRDDLWRLIASCEHLDFLLLTKRPQNILKYLPKDWGAGYPNVWLGTTVENQEEADRRVPLLLGVDAAVHFLSCEPLLGEVDLTRIRRKTPEWTYIDDALTGFRATKVGGSYGTKIDWVICGGESGPNARPMHPDWARGLRDQCKAAGVPFFFKQWGEWMPNGWEHADSKLHLKLSGKLVPKAECDANRDFPGIGLMEVVKVGKKRAGRHLDGVLHNEFPESLR